MASGARTLNQQRMTIAAHNIALLSGTADSVKNHEVHTPQNSPLDEH